MLKILCLHKSLFIDQLEILSHVVLKQEVEVLHKFTLISPWVSMNGNFSRLRGQEQAIMFLADNANLHFLLLPLSFL